MKNPLYFDYEGDLLEDQNNPILCYYLTTSSEIRNGTLFLTYNKTPTSVSVGNEVVVMDKRGAFCDGVLERVDGINIYIRVDRATHLEESATFGNATFIWPSK